jgi:23S rRNA pseudouridine2604 synthase
LNAVQPNPNQAGASVDAAVRLNKRLADLGLCSRREADAWIERGWVRVNGQVAGMGVKVAPTDHVTVDRRASDQQAQRVTMLLHKPIGYVSGQAEDDHLPAVTLIRADSRWTRDAAQVRFSPAQLRGLAPAGRLVIDSTGLLVLTQDGRVARQLIGATATVEKEYLVRVAFDGVTQNVQAVFPREHLALLRHGLALDGQPLKPAQVDWQNPEQLRFVLTEGKKRQIRRMCELAGLTVTALKRVRIGRIALGALPPGQWRYLGAEEAF